MAEITIKDIAKQCGVGVSTVSRAINNHPDINPETKRMILEEIEKTGFIPNNSARNLKRTDAKCIAVLVKGITNPFFSSMIQIIEEETQRNKYALVLRHVEAQEDEIDVALELEKEKRLRGIVFLGGKFEHSEEKIRKL
ncbi:MAG: LacI family transcriptional regulator, partial [Lachnospiraceae bacterium]|nr:LacI family transcriptional regulator [Lachnospiraceae bacterium]